MFKSVSVLSENGPKIRLKTSSTAALFSPWNASTSKKPIIPHSVPLCCLSLLCLFLSLTVGLVLSVPAVGGRYMPATGCGARGETHTTWHVLRVTRVRGSCPRERSLAWWRRRSCAGFTTTPWWRTSNERLRVVGSGSGKTYCSSSQWLSRCLLKRLLNQDFCKLCIWVYISKIFSASINHSGL